MCPILNFTPPQTFHKEAGVFTHCYEPPTTPLKFCKCCFSHARPKAWQTFLHEIHNLKYFCWNMHSLHSEFLATNHSHVCSGHGILLSYLLLLLLLLLKTTTINSLTFSPCFVTLFINFSDKTLLLIHVRQHQNSE